LLILNIYFLNPALQNHLPKPMCPSNIERSETPDLGYGNGQGYGTPNGVVIVECNDAVISIRKPKEKARRVHVLTEVEISLLVLRVVTSHRFVSDYPCSPETSLRA
jgi:hypothetical protein